MNILLVTAMFPPIRTGTSFYSKNLANALMARNHNVTVVTLRSERSIADDYHFTVHRLPAIHVPFKNYFKHFWISSFFPGNYIELNRIARQCRADVILLINHYLDIAFPAVFASKISGIPLVCSVGTELQSDNPRRDKIFNFLDRLICGKLIFPFCNRIIAWDNQVLQYLKDVHGQKATDKAVIINYGVNGDPDILMRHAHDYTLHNQILGVGSIIKQRNFITLVLAFKEIADVFPDLRLKIIGHVYYDAAVQLARELGLGHRIKFTGELPHEEVLEEFKRSDFYFVSLTGKYLGLGTATAESMLMGVPSIANVPPDLLGTALLKHMENIVYSSGISASELGSKIRLLLSDQALRQKIGQKGRQFIIENMNWDKVAREMENLFLSLAAAKKANDSRPGTIS